MDFIENSVQTVAKFPIRIVLLEFPNVADPPDVIADTVCFFVLPFQFPAANLFAELDCFQHRTVALPAAPNIVNLAYPRSANEFLEGLDQIKTVNVVTHLFAFVSQHAIRTTSNGADHQVRKEPVKLGAGVRRAS